jgi:molybdate transport system substrate-binding protein
MWFLLVLFLVNLAFSEVLYLAAASSLRPVLPDLLREFLKTRPEVRVRVSFGSSGGLFAKIRSGAPYHLFLSADTFYPRKLVEEGLAPREGFLVYGRGRVALVYRRGEYGDIGDVVRAKRIAVPNPKHAPYGRAVLQALERSGILEEVRSRLLYGSNVSQTAQFVHTGAAEVGFVSLSIALRSDLRFSVVPEELHDPILHALVITSKGKDSEVAWDFFRFMKSNKVKALLREHGFEVR